MNFIEKLLTETKTKRVSGHIRPVYHVEPPAPLDNIWTWVYGITGTVTLFGPEESREELRARAREMLIKEIYGELQDDILEIQYSLWKEGWRAPDDSVMIALNNLLRKVS